MENNPKSVNILKVSISLGLGCVACILSFSKGFNRLIMVLAGEIVESAGEFAYKGFTSFNKISRIAPLLSIPFEVVNIVRTWKNDNQALVSIKSCLS